MISKFTSSQRPSLNMALTDRSFASIVKAMMWGRAVNDAVKKFLQVSSPSENHIPLLTGTLVVPTHCKHHRCGVDFRLCRFQRKR